MATGLIIIPNYMPVFSANGLILSGAKATFYVAGTTTLVDTYTTPDLDIEHTNPVVADASGKFPLIYVDAAQSYKIKVTTSAGVVLDTIDDIYSVPAPLEDRITGVRNITQNTTYTDFVEFTRSGELNISAGVTVTFAGGISAPVKTIFTGDGTVVFTNGTQFAVYTEWWGAETNNGAFDCQPAIQAAIDSGCTRVQLTPNDYYIDSTIENPHSGVGVYCAGKWYGIGTTNTTRIVATFNTGDAVLFGSLSEPVGGINYYPRNQVWEGGEITRSVAPLAPAVSSEVDDGPVGLRLKYTMNAVISDVRISEQSLGVVLDGNVLATLDRVHAFRSVSGTGPNVANDIFWGVVLNGNASIGLSGGNGSSYINRCHSEVGGSPTLANSIGLNAFGLYADTYIRDFETSGIRDGIQFQGTATTYGNLDVNIDHAVIDGFSRYGIIVDGQSASGAINITNSYLAPRGTNTPVAAIFVTNSGGQVNVSSNEIDCGPNSAAGFACIGLFYQSSTGITSIGNQINDCERPIVLSTVANFTVRDSIKSPISTSTYAAVSAATATRGKIECVVSGITNSYESGYDLTGTACQYVECNMSGVDPAAIQGGANDKLLYNATQQTATGAFGTGNLASGIMS